MIEKQPPGTEVWAITWGQVEKVTVKESGNLEFTIEANDWRDKFYWDSAFLTRRDALKQHLKNKNWCIETYLAGIKKWRKETKQIEKELAKEND